MRRIIAFVGMPGAGKGTCVDYFVDKGYPKVYFGGMVYEEVEKRGLDRVKDEKFVREDMRNIEGADVLAKRASIKTDEYIKQGRDTVILDGLYSWTEYKYLSTKYGKDFFLVAVVTDREKRYQRILSRQDGRKYSRETVIAREVAEIEKLEKGGPIAYADFYVLNNSSIEQLSEQLETISKLLQV